MNETDRRLHTLTKGRVAELRVAAELLQRGFDVFVPIADVRGVDYLVRDPSGRVQEIQVKSASQGRWFQVEYAAAEGSAGTPGRWVACVEPDGTVWLIPVSVFIDSSFSTQSKSKSGCAVYDLNVAATRRGQQASNADRLAQYREVWHLLEEGA